MYNTNIEVSSSPEEACVFMARSIEEVPRYEFIQFASLALSNYSQANNYSSKPIGSWTSCQKQKILLSFGVYIVVLAGTTAKLSNV